MNRFAQTATKVSQMMELTFDRGGNLEKRVTSSGNLVVLSKEKAGRNANNFQYFSSN